MDYTSNIKKYIQEEIEVYKSLDVDIINRIINEIKDAQERGSTIYICGNGGSAATASH